MSRALAARCRRAALLAAAGPSFAQGETVIEIRVHGNHATPDADMLAISGLKTGDPRATSGCARPSRP